MSNWVGCGRQTSRFAAVGIFVGLLAAPAGAFVAPNAPAAFDVAGRAVVLVTHGVGAQIYECEPGAGGQDVWIFREPVAALFEDGRSVGRHYAGPTWELSGGGAVTGKLAASAPGASVNDVPLLKLDVATRHGEGALGNARLVLRLDTHGGVLKGPCPNVGELRAEPYAADYVFLK